MKRRLLPCMFRRLFVAASRHLAVDSQPPPVYFVLGGLSAVDAPVLRRSQWPGGALVGDPRCSDPRPTVSCRQPFGVHFAGALALAMAARFFRSRTPALDAMLRQRASRPSGPISARSRPSLFCLCLGVSHQHEFVISHSAAAGPASLLIIPRFH